VKRIVISGGPSSGKTTIINELKRAGHYCFDEVSRELILEAQKKGIAQPFLTDPEQFNNDLLKARIRQFEKAESLNVTAFYDRGVHDIVGYMHYGKQLIPKSFNEACKNSKYDQVFLLPPWKTIHVVDNERYESFEQANEVYICLRKTYEEFGYKIVNVPVGTVTERKDFILKHIL